MIQTDKGFYYCGIKDGMMSPRDDIDSIIRHMPMLTMPSTATIMQVSVGVGHCLMLDVQGYVYGVGDNGCHRISRGMPENAKIDSPTMVRGSWRLMIDVAYKQMAYVYAIDDSSFCISSAGEVYCWGHTGFRINPRQASKSISEFVVEVKPEGDDEDVKFKRVIGNKGRYAVVSFTDDLYTFGKK